MIIINGFRVRLTILAALISIIFAGIIVQLFYHQVVKGKEWKETGDRQYKSENIVKSKRGRIIANDGEILAYDNENYIITVDPTMIEYNNIDKVVKIIKTYAPNFDAEKAKKEIFDKKQKERRYLKLDTILGINERKAISEELKKEKALKSGIFFEIHFSRNYIKNNAFQETVGFTDKENKGVYGIEKFYNEQLTGVDGLIEGYKSPRNFLIIPMINSKKEPVSPKNGSNVILTIDSVLQYAMDDEMKRAYESNNAVATMGILMEVETGKILAMSSYPKATTNASVKNRPITDLFEPGSIFKPITVATGLETGKINKNSLINSSGSIQVADRIIRDHDGSTSGNLTLQTLIAKSGNVGMVKISQMVDRKTFHQYLENLGLGSKTGIDVFSEASYPLIKENKLSEVKKANISFGQGISMTQIQMMMALNTVVNNGKLMKPYIVDRLEDDAGNIVLKNNPQVIKKVYSDEVSKLNRQYMEAVVTSGTGSSAHISGYRIGGKTGTAQKSGARGYESGKYFSSFFGFFPVENPKYAILITINEPRGSKYYGAAVALPSAKTMLEKLIRYKGISPDGIIEEERKEVPIISEVPKDLKKMLNEFNKNKMPDLTGISLRELLSIYPHEKFANYKIVGSGKVKGQSPSAGMPLDKNSVISLILE